DPARGNAGVASRRAAGRPAPGEHRTLCLGTEQERARGGHPRPLALGAPGGRAQTGEAPDLGTGKALVHLALVERSPHRIRRTVPSGQEYAWAAARRMRPDARAPAGPEADVR